MKQMISSFLSSLSLLFGLTLRDLKERYVSSYLGIMWEFVQPVITVLLMWVVFSVGFKARPVAEVPFIEWLIPGYLMWQYLSGVISSGTRSIVESSYLVKKIVFRVEILPVVKIMSGLAVHGAFMVLIVIGYGVERGGIGVEWLQVVYYLLSGTCLAYGLIMLSSAAAVFVRDTVPMVNMMLQVGFWGTPIFWDIGQVPAEYRWIVELNPMSYVVEGYRQSMLGGTWFFERPESVNYWIETAVIVLIGRYVFRKMRPHFADVL